jgi:hypothetical protein
MVNAFKLLTNAAHATQAQAVLICNPLSLLLVTVRPRSMAESCALLRALGAIRWYNRIWWTKAGSYVYSAATITATTAETTTAGADPATTPGAPTQHLTLPHIHTILTSYAAVDTPPPAQLSDLCVQGVLYYVRENAVPAACGSSLALQLLTAALRLRCATPPLIDVLSERVIADGHASENGGVVGAQRVCGLAAACAAAGHLPTALRDAVVAAAAELGGSPTTTPDEQPGASISASQARLYCLAQVAYALVVSYDAAAGTLVSSLFRVCASASGRGKLNGGLIAALQRLGRSSIIDEQGDAIAACAGAVLLACVLLPEDKRLATGLKDALFSQGAGGSGGGSVKQQQVRVCVCVCARARTLLN